MINILTLGARILFSGLVISIASLEAFATNDIHANESHGIRFTADPSPKFPSALWKQGIFSGQATLAVTVDTDGTLEEWLVIEASHVDLASSIEEVVEQWEFEPAVIEGVPIYGSQRLFILFDATKQSRSQELYDSRTFMENHLTPIRKHRFRGVSNGKQLLLANPSEVDQYPEPIAQPAPLISEKTLEESIGGRAVFKFFIDTSGSAKIPTLYELYGEVAPEALVAVQSAIRNWRFKPLKSKGKPVVIEVSQVFEFNQLRVAP